VKEARLIHNVIKLHAPAAAAAAAAGPVLAAGFAAAAAAVVAAAAAQRLLAPAQLPRPCHSHLTGLPAAAAAA